MDMNAALWFFVGAALGWLASSETGATGLRNVAINVVSGAVGAVGAGGAFAVLVDAGSIGPSLGALAVAPLGAIMLLALVNLLRLQRIR